MPRLMLLRHAKSSWAETATTDFERPLAPRGLRAAPLMGQHMQTNDLLPDRVLCSSALRTRQTLCGLLPAFDHDFEVLFLRALYDAIEDDYLEIVRKHGGTARSLLVIGHNPATQASALALAGSAKPDEQKRLKEAFPTAALAVFDIEGDDWSALRPSHGRLTAFIKPRELEPDRPGPNGDTDTPQ